MNPGHVCGIWTLKGCEHGLPLRIIIGIYTFSHLRNYFKRQVATMLTNMLRWDTNASTTSATDISGKNEGSMSEE